MNDREPIYDEQVAPLMTEIIRICLENDIPMVACFQLSDGDRDEDEEMGPMFCTTALLEPEWTDDRLFNAKSMLYKRPVLASIILSKVKTRTN